MTGDGAGRPGEEAAGGARGDGAPTTLAGARPGAPEPVTLTHLLEEERSETPWRIRGCLPAGGRVVLASQRKAGKTTLVANLARSLVDGDDFLGRYDVEVPTGRVVLLDVEMQRTQLAEWLGDVGITRTDRITVWPLRGYAEALDLLDPAVRARVADQLRALDTAVLVIDCLRPIMDALGLDEHREAGRLLVHLDSLVAAADIGELVVVHHAGHVGERSRGDSRLRDWPDAEWRLVRERPSDPADEPGPDARRYFAAEGRDVAIAEGLLTYDPDTRRLALAGGSRRETAGDALVPAVLDCVAHPAPGGALGWSGRAIETALMSGGHQRQRIRDAVRRARDLGSITTISGPRRSTLHVPSAPVRRDPPGALAHYPSQCASAPIGGALHSLGAADVVAERAAGALAGVAP